MILGHGSYAYVKPLQLSLTLGQVIGEKIINAWSCAGLFTLLEKGKEGKDVMQILAKEFLDAVHQRRAELAELRTHQWQSVQSVFEAVSRVARLCKCMLHVFNVPYNHVGDVTAPVNHVLYFWQYGGKEVFERSIRKVLTQSEWLSGLINEVIKTAASTKSLEPKMAALQAIIKCDSLSLENIKQASELIVELEGGMRRGALNNEKNQFLVKLQSVGKEILKNPVDPSTNSLVKAVLKGLCKFHDKPGVLDLKKDLETYMGTHQSAMASMELINRLDAMIKEREFHWAQLNEAVKACDRANIEQDVLDRMDEFLHELGQISSGQAN